ncbi:MAG: TonB-dependent receptor [Paludibacteraceae bacterium]|nr:TonB-dependent receptor [Paludibacteraceae bacterium]
MKKLLTILLTITSLVAQAQYDVIGKVYDARTRQTLDFVNVSSYTKGQTVPLNGTSTDTNGAFKLSLPNGQYILRFTFIGYQEIEKNITVNNQAVNLGKIYLQEDNQQLQEVEVVAQGSNMRFELDKKVFSVDQNIASAGGVATDILQNIPSIDVDGEGNVSLRNSESVEVWINGKPSGLTAENRGQILQQLPAESIKEIEVITNPSAKYDPEGTSGIINIVMKKNRKAGYYGSVAAGVTYPTGGKLGYNVSANINYSQGRVDSYLNIGYRHFSGRGANLSDRYDYMGTDTTRLYQKGVNEHGGGGLFLRAGIDVRITDKSTIGLSGFGMLNRNANESARQYELTNCINNSILRSYDRNEDGKGKHPGYDLTLDYRVNFTEKQNLIASVSYSSHKSSNTSIFQNTVNSDTLSREEQYSKNDNSRWTIKADYTNNFTQNSRLEIGWQTSLNNRLNIAEATNLLTNQPLEAFYNHFDYHEQIHALYATYGNRFWERLSVQVGLRGEYMLRNTETNGTPNEPKSYFELFPSAYISYSFPKNHELQLNYTRRVDRVRGRQINPFRNMSDSTNIFYGNPDLSPQFSSALELNYLKNWERHTISAGLFYRFTDQVIQNIRYVTGGQMENTFVNVSKSQNVGLELVGKNRLWGNLLQLTTSINAYYSQMDSATYKFDKATVFIPKQNNFTWSARLNASFMFTKFLSGQITGRYSSPRLIAQGKTTHSYALDLGLRAAFLDNQLSINLMARDILNSRGRKSERWGDNFFEYSEHQWHGRSIGLTLTYNFGNMKPKRRPMRESITADDEGMGGEE